ncbi:QacE family quaternary ammonium compound efflux SMR transporter [Exiguobacterium sp. SH0S1]|uniref:DMT family transporter n=1 Tax=Exiguobacterium sp. SH0S1 TaxID=2510949 RepID=UPI00103C7784|nr:SMR family transporter [Exiguobacterium sp. SH0S1]TCI77834.1 QacE family quaternary ammonium compound efflux SMR transporter [Exiguobacterium sp. SH0S1]
MGFAYLVAAIIAEVFGSSMLKLNATSTNRLPILGVALGYVTAFYLLSLALLSIPLSFAVSFTLMGFVLKTIPLSIAYSVWAGLGTVATGLIVVFAYGEVLSTLNSIGLIVIVLGVIVMNFGKTNTVYG